MNFNILGREFLFEMKDNRNRDTRNNVKNTIRKNKGKFIYRFLLLSIIFFIFGIFVEAIRLKPNYTVGSIAESDIIAYKNVTYSVDLLDDNIQDKIFRNTTPEYDKIPEVNKETRIAINEFFRDLRETKFYNDDDIKKFIQSRKYNLTVEDVKKILIRVEDPSYLVNISDIVSEIYDEGIIRTEDFPRIIREKEIRADNLDLKFLKNFIKPNLKLNEQETEKKIADNIASLKDREVNIYKGDTIVKKGDIIDNDAYLKLEKLGMVRGGAKIIKITGLVITFIILIALLYTILKRNCKELMESNVFYPMLITIIFLDVLYIIFLKNNYFTYILPFAMLPLIGTILGGRLFSFVLTFTNILVLSREESWLLVMIAVALVAIYKADNLTSRSDIIKISLFLGIFQAVVSVSYGLVNQLNLVLLMTIIIFSVFGGLITGVISLGVLPYFENTFDILTNMRLLELSDFSHTLLKQLLVKAPGTFHHSIMVGALAESGAEAINANATFARIASYYHDIGKMKRPEFFVENQKGGENPHNKTKPSLSALILTSHTKDGYIMGKQNKLPKEILDVILEHHGTTLVQFFYYKALENGEKVVESNFRYSGPKPKTKESGIILMADTVEAAVRTLEDKSREGIENFIRYLIRTKIDDNQLSDSALTLGEIEKVIQAFVNTLQGVYHERIKYPKLDERRKKKIEK
ncbi:HD family phosphohydrolase [Leptotrichia sp. oral taxon 221]|jgi:metal dependent phosphohydrolase|uniref:HD family phosphohydrolase n=1 Tax=Leptotrichia sp. oral taxon 221 TaxID=712362 RepID=UPI001B8D744F|nr:HDIG domain-containing metalloprotein [Leptotrichia sp. oral taxon 221]QUB97704.1 HDIG domain-containing protein [Leptotrichia sp. oral taxon 221]